MTPKKTGNAKIDAVARLKLRFLFSAERLNAFMAEIAASAAAGQSVKPDEESHWIEITQTLLEPDKNPRGDAISIQSAPFEFSFNRHSFTNSLGEDDEWDEELERIITPWGERGESLRETTFILVIDPKAPRKTIWRDIREWLKKYGKKHPANLRIYRTNYLAAQYHYSLATLYDAKFSVAEIEEYLKSMELQFKAKKQGAASESRRYIKELYEKIRAKAKSTPIKISRLPSWGD